MAFYGFQTIATMFIPHDEETPDAHGGFF